MGEERLLVLKEKELRHLLEPVFDTYHEYACSDGRNFAGNIGCVRKADDNVMKTVAIDDWDEIRKVAKKSVMERIEARTDIDKQFEAAAFGATLGAAQGYTAKKIKEAADNIDAARSAVCTTFAVSGANKLLELQHDPSFNKKIKRIEIIARKYGHRGTHCYLIINRQEGADLKKPETWGEDVLIADPWLASLQNPSIYNAKEYALTGFLDGKLECNFDSTNLFLRDQKRRDNETKKQIKQTFISYVKDGDLDRILELLSTFSLKVEKVKLGKGYENLFTQAIKYHQDYLFKALWAQIEDPEFVQKRGPLILNRAIASNNFELVQFLHDNGVELCGHTAEPFAIERAFEIALSTGDDRMFAYIFEQEIAHDPSCQSILSTLVKLPQLKSEQGLYINSYISRLPEESIIKLLRWASNSKDILQYVGAQLEDYEKEAKDKYPNAFRAAADSAPSLSSMLPLSPLSSPLPSLSSEEPPPAPKMPAPDYFKPVPKSQKEAELRKYRRERSYRVETLKEHCKNNLHMELANDVLAHLGEHIDKWDKQKNYWVAYSRIQKELTKHYESEPSLDKRVQIYLILLEYQDGLLELTESIQFMKKELVDGIALHADSASFVASKQAERLKFILKKYQVKLQLISNGMDKHLAQSLDEEFSDKLIEQRTNLSKDIQNLFVVLKSSAATGEHSLIAAAQLGDLEIVKNLVCKTSKLSERDHEGKTFLDYLNRAQTKELTDFLFEKNAISNALKIALLQQDVELVKKISNEHHIQFFELDSKDDSIWDYLPSQTLDESTFSKMSFFFVKHETFNHWLAQTLKDEFNKCNKDFQVRFNHVELELMELNETIMGVREPAMSLSNYIENATLKCNEVQDLLNKFESQYSAILNPKYQNLHEFSLSHKTLKQSLHTIHQLLDDIRLNTEERIKVEEEIKNNPRSTI